MSIQRDRKPRQDERERAYQALAIAAKEAAIILNESGRGQGTYLRLKEALFNIGQLTADDVARG